MLLVERLSHTNHWTGRHPAEKLVLGGGLLLSAVLLPPLPGAPLVLAAAVGAALLGARLPAADYARVLAWPAGFLVVSAATLAVSVQPIGDGPLLSLPAAQVDVAIKASLRALAATSAMLLIILTTPLAEMLGALRRARLPAALVDIMLLVYRFVAIALEAADHARTAQASRLGYAGLRRSIRSSGRLAAALLPRVLDRAVRMQTGLASRGYSGELRVLAPARPLSLRFLALALLAQATIAAARPRRSMVILAARALGFRYPGGIVALDGLDLDIAVGETLAILGPNGSGKTTLLLHLNGSLRPERGEILIDGQAARYDQRALNRWRAQVGLVLQDPDDQLFAGSVFQDVSFGPLNLGLAEREVRAQVAEALEHLHIAALADRPVHMLSLGQKRRAAIAGVLAMEPRVLVLDEPTAGLDPHGVVHLLSVLRRLAEAGTTIVYTTHDVDLALAWSDRVALFAGGRVRACGIPEVVLGDDTLLRAAHLRRPILLELGLRARDLGLIGVDQPLPKSMTEMNELLRRLAGRIPAPAVSD